MLGKTCNLSIPNSQWNGREITVIDGPNEIGHWAAIVDDCKFWFSADELGQEKSSQVEPKFTNTKHNNNPTQHFGIGRLSLDTDLVSEYASNLEAYSLVAKNCNYIMHTTNVCENCGAPATMNASLGLSCSDCYDDMSG